MIGAAYGQRAGLRSGVFHPGQPELGQQGFLPARRGPDVSPAEVMEAFLGQFYDNKEPPRQLILSDGIENADLMQEALTEKAGRKVEILVPQRGEKAGTGGRCLAQCARVSGPPHVGKRHAGQTAARAWPRRSISTAPPERIEVYDNSHIQGTNAVGGMIVAGPEGFMKNAYRKFNIRGDDLTPGDDFGMMKEVLTRRFHPPAKRRPRSRQRAVARPAADRRRRRAGERGA